MNPYFHAFSASQSASAVPMKSSRTGRARQRRRLSRAGARCGRLVHSCGRPGPCRRSAPSSCRCPPASGSSGTSCSPARRSHRCEPRRTSPAAPPALQFACTGHSARKSPRGAPRGRAGRTRQAGGAACPAAQGHRCTVDDAAVRSGLVRGRARGVSVTRRTCRGRVGRRGVRRGRLRRRDSGTALAAPDHRSCQRRQ